MRSTRCAALYPFIPYTPAPGGVAAEHMKTLMVEQVAERVGYANASSFVHAFTRWKGMAPRRWAARSA